MNDRMRRVTRTPRSARLAVAAAGLVAGSVALAACSSSSSSSASAGGGASGGSSGAKVGVSLILKTLTNPYFVSMENDAQEGGRARTTST